MSAALRIDRTNVPADIVPRSWETVARRLVAELGLEENVVFGHDVVSRITGVQRSHAGHGSLVRAWKKLLLDEHRLVLKSVPGVGYKILPPREHVYDVGSDTKSIVRKVKRTQKKSDAIAIGRLESKADEEKAVHLQAAVALLSTGVQRASSLARTAIGAINRQSKRLESEASDE